MASRKQEIKAENDAKLIEYMRNAPAPVKVQKRETEKNGVGEVKTSGAAIRSEGLTPQRVYSLNNGAGYSTKRCRRCHAEFRTIESEPCEPGHIAVAELNITSYLANRDAAKRTSAKEVGIAIDGYLMPLGSEYMYHRGTKGAWILPDKARKVQAVASECQAIKRAKHARIDPELCRDCYKDLLKELAKGKPLGKEVLTITRRKGKIVHVTERVIMPSPEQVAIARLETAKGKRKHTVKVAQNASSNPAATQPGLFAAIATQAGVNDDKPFRMHVEARTLAEARRLLAECFGKTVNEFERVNIYRVVDDGYGSETLKRVA